MKGHTYKKGGKGRKQCPNCNAFISEECAACPACHKLFDEEPEVLPEPQQRRAEKKVPAIPRVMLKLRIPSGANPVKLKGKDKQALTQWAGAVRDYWLTKGYWLLNEGLCYYLQWESQYEDHPKAYEAACRIINELSEVPPEPKQP